MLQPETEILHQYIAYGAAQELFWCDAPEVLFEGPAGTGKTVATLQKIAYLCEQYPGTRALICRMTKVSCNESILVTLERDVLHGYPWIMGDASRAHRTVYTCANGSTIVVGGLDNPEKLYSTEWDIVYVAEAIEIDEDSWEKFARAMRNRAIPKGISGSPLQAGEAQAVETDAETGITAPAFWTQRIADCNPGAPGHWLNQRPTHNQRMVRLRSRHSDNPSITPGELAELRSLTGHRRARLFEGRWVAAEGGVFPEFDLDRNTCERFDVADWPVTVGYDPGYHHPCAVVFYCIAPNGQHFVVDRIYGSGIDLPRLQDMLAAKAKLYRIVDWLDDPNGANQATQVANGKTIRSQMRDAGFPFRPWPAAKGPAKQSQVEAVRKLLIATNPLRVFDDCVEVIDEFQSWSYSRMSDGSMKQGDDAYEDRNNDAMDAICGIVACNPKFETPRGTVVRQR